MSIRRRSRFILGGVAVLTCVAATLIVGAAPAAAVPGLVRVTAWSPTGSPDFQGARANCPAGTKLLGGGGDVIGGGHSVQLYMVEPSEFYPDAMEAAATEDTYGYSGSWSVRAWAICGSGVTGHEIVSVQTSMVPGQTTATATAICPTGKKVIGLGASTWKSRSVLDAMTTVPHLNAVHVRAYRNEADPGTNYIAVNAHAICINPVPGLQLVSASSGYDSADKFLTVNCPTGTKVHATGGSVSGSGQAYIDGLIPNAFLTSVNLDAHEDSTGHSGNWNAWLYAVCAT